MTRRENLIALAALLAAAPSFGQQSQREARKAGERAGKEARKRAKRAQKQARRREKDIRNQIKDRDRDSARRNAELVRERKRQRRDVGSRTTSDRSPFEPGAEESSSDDKEIRVKQRGLEVTCTPEMRQGKW